MANSNVINTAIANGIALDNARNSNDCIVYRRGGSENFTWHRSIAMTRSEAIDAQAATEKMGYRCYIVNYNQSLAIGLPETYE